MTPAIASEQIVETLGDLLWTSLGDEAVVFDRLTGNTHALNPELARSLRAHLLAGASNLPVLMGEVEDSSFAQLRGLGLV